VGLLPADPSGVARRDEQGVHRDGEEAHRDWLKDLLGDAWIPPVEFLISDHLANSLR